MGIFESTGQCHADEIFQPLSVFDNLSCQSVIYYTFLAHRQGVLKGGIVIIRCVGDLSKIAGGTNNLSLFLVQ